MTDAEVTAYLAGRELAGDGAEGPYAPATMAQIDAMAEVPTLKDAYRRLGSIAFRHWVFRGCWDRLGEPDALC
jgi:hypothetical protein